MSFSPKWLPRSLNDRAVWYQNFSTQFSIVAVTPLGFTAADVNSVADDNQVVQFAADQTAEVDAFGTGFRKWRNSVLLGDDDGGAPLYPTNPTAIPPVTVDAGVFERLNSLVARIRHMPNYTDEIGAMLGILGSGPSAPEPFEELQPSLKLTTQPGSVVRVSFVRGTTEGVKLEMQLDNQNTWTDAGRFFKSPAEVVVPQNPESLPRAVKFRARYIENDQAVGLFSPVVSTATMPES